MKAPDLEGAARGIAQFLSALGYDLNSPELAETPERVALAFASELLAGERADLKALLAEGSESAGGKAPGLVVLSNVQVTTVCPHHLLPALGTATLGYLPGKRVLGLGTLARLVELSARRLVLQESIGEAVVQALLEHAGAEGAFCRLDLVHTCLASRGAKHPEARVVTLARGGSLASDAATLDLALILGRQAEK